MRSIDLEYKLGNVVDGKYNLYCLIKLRLALGFLCYLVDVKCQKLGYS